MSTQPPLPFAEFISSIFRTESRRVYASLVRSLRDFDLAEDAVQEAFAAAAEKWPTEGIPDNPRAWLVSTGRFKAIDTLRRRGLMDELKGDITTRFVEIAESNETRKNQEIEDDRLRLIFACCHPAIDPSVQVPLTLRECISDGPHDVVPANCAWQSHDSRCRNSHFDPDL
jgi:RNA polymerase sigma-70 factor, ECF subfamily